MSDISGISVEIFKQISSPSGMVSAYIEDFRNANDWMVGVESIEQRSDEEYKLTLDSPVGRLEPEAKIVEHRPGYIRWVYTSTVEGGGQVEVVADDSNCVVRYKGQFQVRAGSSPAPRRPSGWKASPAGRASGPSIG